MPAKIRRHRVEVQAPILTVTNPMAHVGYLESRHLHPERLPSGRKEQIVSLRLIDASVSTIFHIQSISTTIRRLTASNLHLKNVPKDLVRPLVHLTKIDLSNNKLGDASFPDCMKQLVHLVEIRFAGNNLTKVPGWMSKFKSLRRLDLSNNKIVSCTGLDQHTRLKILVLDNNTIVSLFKEISTLRKLEVLRCSGNQIREISQDLRNMSSLVDLDLSDNCIGILPPDVFLLPRLDVFFACKNEIVRVPTFNVRPQKKLSISHVDLSDNKLSKFPGHLFLVTTKLDLSNNRIRSLPYHMIKKLDVTTDKQLLMKDNPISYPPSDVCDSGIKSIISFFKESESEVKFYQGVKVLVVGHHKSGKTSLVQCLVDQQPRVSEELYESSGGIDVYDMTFDLEEDIMEGAMGKSLELSIWDFCGHPFYLYPHHAFFEHPSVTILTFDLSKYTDETFDEHIGCWVDWMLAKTNKIVFVLVGTNSDKLTKAQITKVCRDVKRKLGNHLENQANFIKDRIKEIEQRPHISPTLSDQLKHYMKLFQTRTTNQTDVICISATKFSGFDKVRQAIIDLTNDRRLFPNIMRAIPTFWLAVRYYIEDRGNAMPFPVMKWEIFEKEVTSRFGMKPLLKAIAQYLHETGQILWFSSIPSLKGLLFIRPSWFFDVLRLLLRYDFENFNLNQDFNFRMVGVTPTKLESLKQDVITNGVLHRDLIKCILAPFHPTDPASLTSEVIKLLADGFGLGYPTSTRQKDSINQPELSEDSVVQTTEKLFIPWLRKNTEPNEFSLLWHSLNHNRKLACYFMFPVYFPPGLFEVICVRTHSEKYKLCFVQQWGGGIHAKHKEENVHVLVTYFQSNNNDDRKSGTILLFEAREGHTNNNLQVLTSTLWTILLPVLLDIEQVLTGYSGILVERRTECPLCQEMSFLGEWLTPKETQSFATRVCESCEQEVDTSLLVPPRENRRVIIRKTNPTPSPRITELLEMTPEPTVSDECKTDLQELTTRII